MELFSSRKTSQPDRDGNRVVGSSLSSAGLGGWSHVNIWYGRLVSQGTNRCKVCGNVLQNKASEPVSGNSLQETGGRRQAMWALKTMVESFK